MKLLTQDSTFVLLRVLCRLYCKHTHSAARIVKVNDVKPNLHSYIGRLCLTFGGACAQVTRSSLLSKKDGFCFYLISVCLSVFLLKIDYFDIYI